MQDNSLPLLPLRILVHLWFKQKAIQLLSFPRNLLEWMCKITQMGALFYASSVLAGITPENSHCRNHYEQKGRKVGASNLGMGHFFSSLAHFQFSPTSWLCRTCCHVLLHLYMNNEEAGVKVNVLGSNGFYMESHWHQEQLATVETLRFFNVFSFLIKQ